MLLLSNSKLNVLYVVPGGGVDRLNAASIV
jgi:hypothetical protein